MRSAAARRIDEARKRQIATFASPHSQGRARIGQDEDATNGWACTAGIPAVTAQFLGQRYDAAASQGADDSIAFWEPFYVRYVGVSGLDVFSAAGSRRA